MLVTVAGPVPREQQLRRGKVAVDHENKIYCADYTNHQVAVFSEDLVLIRTFRVLENPNPIFIHNQRVYVGSTAHSNIGVYSLEGVLKFSFDVSGAFYIVDIFITKDGYLLAASNLGISIFDAGNGSMIVNYPRNSLAHRVPFGVASITLIEKRGNLSKLLVAQTTSTTDVRPCICLLLYTRPVVAWIYSPLNSSSFSDVEIVVPE